MTTKDMVLGLILALFFVTLIGNIPTTNASNYVVRNDGIIPPVIVATCSDSFIGASYNPKLENRCRFLWNQWTREILMNFYQQ